MARKAGRAQAPRGRRSRPGLLRTALRWCALGLLLAFTALLALQLWYFGHVLWWAGHNPDSSAFMREQEKQLRSTDPNARLRQRWVAYDRISEHLKRAVIAAEDANFNDHDGVDWDAIERAYDQNLRRGKVVRGGSTITMQLAKNLFLSGDRSYWRKAQELSIAFMLETVMDKDRILELYLNFAEWGVGVFGCEAAAQHYYGVGAARLGPAQSARLAAMLPRPRYYDRNRAAPALARRAGMIARGMAAVEAP